MCVCVHAWTYLRKEGPWLDKTMFYCTVEGTHGALNLHRYRALALARFQWNALRNSCNDCVIVRSMDDGSILFCEKFQRNDRSP